MASPSSRTATASSDTLGGGSSKTRNPTNSTSSSSAWRHPTLAQQQKYGVRPLPDHFVPTAEEELVLEMYEVLRSHERLASRLRDEAARAKLAAKDEQSQQQQQQRQPGGVLSTREKKTKRARRVDDSNPVGDDDDDYHEDEDDDDNDEFLDDDGHGDATEEQLAQARHQRREAKLAALRQEVDKAKNRLQAEQQDKLRATASAAAGIGSMDEDQHENDILEGGTLLRKNLDRYGGEASSSSLIANLTAADTPPHDFSKKLALSVIHGKVLFPTSIHMAGAGGNVWVPPPEGASSPNEGAFLQYLADFNVEKAQNGVGNNTLAIKFMAPSESKRFSINIAAPGHDDDFNSILFHFNPRQHERGGQLVINDKREGVWGQAINIPLSRLPLIFGQTACTLLIQINGDGFDIFMDDKHCARLEHRTELPSGDIDLVLQLPSTDDYGSPENWAVYKIWWGNRPLMAKGDLSGVPGVNTYSSVHPRKLFISSLPKIYSQADVDVRRAELERAFRKYGGDRGVTVLVPTHATYAFVEMETERQADLAMSEMAGQYRLNRARRSKHEALQEERAAAEAAKRGETKRDVTEWD